MTRTTVIDVQGMHCAHCVRAVTNEVAALEGVRDVSIDLELGKPSTVTVLSEDVLDADAVRAAVDEAGYTVAAIRSGA